MTGSAVCSQHAAMQIILFMAGETIRWRAFEDFIQMAFITIDGGVGIDQFESGAIMVKVRRRPSFRRMA